MAINPLSAALAAVQLGSGIAAMRNRLGDRSGQDRIRRLLAQAQGRNARNAQQIASSGEGINPALAQRAALGFLTDANREATESAMNQEAAMAERDRARTDRLTGGMLGALGSFGAQLLAGQDTSETANAVKKVGGMTNALTPEAPPTAEPMVPELPPIDPSLDPRLVRGEIPRLEEPTFGQGVGQRNFSPNLGRVGNLLRIGSPNAASGPSEANVTSGTISMEELERRLRERGDDFTLSPTPNRPSRMDELRAGRVQWDNPSAYISALRRQGDSRYGGGNR